MKKETGTAKFILGWISFVRYPLASGPEGVTLEGKKMAMAGTRGVAKKRGSMPTLLNVTKTLLLSEKKLDSR